jgi:hypothetical protein
MFLNHQETTISRKVILASKLLINTLRNRGSKADSYHINKIIIITSWSRALTENIVATQIL